MLAQPMSALPSTALVVGVTGHRSLRPSDLPILEQQVRDVLRNLQTRYPRLPLVVVSPLAAGSDQLVARIALEMRIRVIAPLPLPVADGPAILAMRPESISLTGGNQAKIHRVTDYGTHGLVDIDLPDGTRIKSMIGNARAFEAGQSVDIKPSAIAAYRDNAVIHRT